MALTNRFHNSISSKSKTIVSLTTFLAICGTFIVLIGGVWDSSSHELKIPDTFWTIQHITIYTGASLVAASAVMASLAVFNNHIMIKTVKIILLGAGLQLGGGYADYNFHEIYGIDGLVTPSHLAVESGLLLSSIGSYSALRSLTNSRIQKMIPISIVTMLLSAAWIGFNLFLLVGAVVLCVPVYQMFSSGCAVM